MDAYPPFQPYALSAGPAHLRQPLPPMASVFPVPPPRSSPSLSSRGSPPVTYVYPAHYTIKQEPPHSPPPQKLRLRQQDQAAAAAAKLHRDHLRKVSHSAIERRRRERINDKIMQMKSLVPACANQDSLHKLRILEEAIQYIHILKGELAEARGGGERGHDEHDADDDDHDEHKTSPLQAPHPYDTPATAHRQHLVVSDCSPLPRPAAFATTHHHPSSPVASPSSSSSSSSSPACASEADFDEVPGARELLLLSGQHRILRPSPEPSEPLRGSHCPQHPPRQPKMSVGHLLC
ncbi:hypothetical protein HDU87_006103 [Geranomyces variabilis]|uniref:BHLH domain-containing protein n=1 Tax=Geranomyces variabilis TaxID=109894 RepID=A0AAD5TLK2_9FUNG|nr:hypothetical protein HDU87_006103 [Geranomyces variabilis]